MAFIDKCDIVGHEYTIRYNEVTKCLYKNTNMDVPTMLV